MFKIFKWLGTGGSRAPTVSVSRTRIDLGPTQPIYPIYAIGDVHGCMDELDAAEETIVADIAASQNQPGLVVLLGDYVDRGPHSSSVIAHLTRTSERGLKRLPLCGNHDSIFSQFISNPQSAREWLDLGGTETLFSYGVDIRHMLERHKLGSDEIKAAVQDAIPLAHQDFLKKLPVSLRVGDYVFVHAGLRPGIELAEQSEKDLLWIREPFLTRGPELPLTVVHGHTPVTEPEFGVKRIGIDTGSYFTGKLTVLKIHNGITSIL